MSIFGKKLIWRLFPTYILSAGGEKNANLEIYWTSAICCSIPFQRYISCPYLEKVDLGALSNLNFVCVRLKRGLISKFIELLQSAFQYRFNDIYDDHILKKLILGSLPTSIVYVWVEKMANLEMYWTPAIFFSIPFQRYISCPYLEKKIILAHFRLKMRMWNGIYVWHIPILKKNLIWGSFPT